MCNEVARRIAIGQIREDWSELKIPLRFPEGVPNLAPLDSVRITDPSAIIRASLPRAAELGEQRVSDPPLVAELVVRRWSWPGPTGKPVYNFRSEGRDFGSTATVGRCLIVVDAFYEFKPRPPRAAASRAPSARESRNGVSPSAARTGSASPASGGPTVRSARPGRC